MNLLHIPSGRIVESAQSKSQCAKDYLYGEDLRLEHMLSNIEGEYATVLRKVESGEQLNLQDLAQLRTFAWLQYHRTTMAFARHKAARKMMEEATYRGYPRSEPYVPRSEQQSMLASMRLFVDSLDTLDDLRVCIVESPPGIQFVTSDDPAVITNRYQFQSLGIKHIGIGSAGSMLVMPLTPNHTLLCYDEDVYNIEDIKDHRVKITKNRDVQAFNQLQYIKAEKNIYFRDISHSKSIANDCLAAQNLKPKTWYVVRTQIITRETADRTYIRPATKLEASTSPKRIISLQGLFPEPNKWPSILKIKLKPKYFSNGSMSGRVRIAVARIMQNRSLTRKAPLNQIEIE